jgi:hypothetical protein
MAWISSYGGMSFSSRYRDAKHLELLSGHPGGEALERNARIVGRLPHRARWDVLGSVWRRVFTTKDTKSTKQRRKIDHHDHPFSFYLIFSVVWLVVLCVLNFLASS